MIRKRARDIRQIMQQSRLSSVQQRTEQFQLWQRVWQESLPADLAPFCRCTAVSQGVIKIAVASAAWIPRLRMLEPHLIDYFNQFLEQPVHATEIKVDPGFSQRR
ncbi:hypothetical protein CWE12_04720 [Aliidiomarina sedimenti]|uniref:DUF721 domain-containing protein n=1 Tax=Aliidiomarina sedimenti TaxID=1933879 RepID=A0ABY0BZS4_9GAMM|nr:DUF721 domain-containing protein [Aliidiomarina sedimenti]RUO30561.1 hypothetical protein CWE12_04720 [Aliidiomarina sedimenti]